MEFEWTGNRQKAFEDLKIQLATVSQHRIEYFPTMFQILL
jgi:hypothetical protein